jgi:hypothetical protein
MCTCTPDGMCRHHQEQFDRDLDAFLAELER